MQKSPLAAFIVVVSIVSPVVKAADLPPRPDGEMQDAVLKCHAIHSRHGPVTGTVELKVSVNAAGRATGVATPPGTDERVAAAAQCVGLALTYHAAVEAEVAVPGQLQLPVLFPTLPSLKYPLRSTIDY
ncbi:MAG: hypothetical protein M3O07_06645, partial [Pseudomonadota bacterium]|nr:hypothetical protein [Pseudomonadota bacterium]